MRSAGIFLLLAIALAGCEKRSEPPLVPVRAPGNSEIHGIIKFIGTPPPIANFPNAICAGTQKAIPEEAIVIGPAGGLANCLVYLKGISAATASPLPPAVLDQIDCRYVPHVLGVMTNQPLAIRSEDATPHNVHLQTSVNPTANFAFTQPHQQTLTQFAYPEIFKVTCDVHPWMSAWVGVFPSPYFVVTDLAGHFEIKNVPVGDYTLVVWQERLGEKEQPIHISDHETLEENFSYAPSAAGAQE